jgi:hypothetical protein
MKLSEKFRARATMLAKSKHYADRRRAKIFIGLAILYEKYGQ